MVCFIDDHREAYGVEPICTVLPIAPSTYHRHRAGQLDPRRRWARAHRDDALHSEIQRVYNAHYHVDGLRKVWKQLCRKGFRVARCTMRRLMRAMGLAGAVRGRAWITTTHAGDGGQLRKSGLKLGSLIRTGSATGGKSVFLDCPVKSPKEVHRWWRDLCLN